MTNLAAKLAAIFGVFPSWLAIIALSFIALFIIILLIKIVGAVLDAIPFL